MRKAAEHIEVLLILSKKQPRMRIFPKGHIEPGETPADAAARELLEEAGVEGRLLGEADVLTYEFREKWYRVAYFYFAFDRCISGGENGRDPCWYSLSDACAVIKVNNLHTLLTSALISQLSF